MFGFPLDNFARAVSFCTHNPARTSSTPQTVTSLGAPKIQRWIIEPQYVLVYVCLRVWGHAHQHAFVCMQKPRDNFECHSQGHHLPPLLQDWSLSWSLLISLSLLPSSEITMHDISPWVLGIGLSFVCSRGTHLTD